MKCLLFQDKTIEWINDLTSFGSLPFYGAVMMLFLFINDILTFFKLLLSLILVIAITFVIRSIYFKVRPENKGKKKMYGKTLERLDASSFPSVHAARTAVLAVLLYSTITTGWMLIFSICFLFVVMTTRLFLKKHDIIDVLCGALLGFIIGYVFFISLTW